ncbi:MAG TPA: sensor domain-containing diguanylate cyclase [Gemmatimonadaceae bacterium]|nr:sensor domain-containing diguanylate cyclase [Gemmatimonadaceae bacterium]
MSRRRESIPMQRPAPAGFSSLDDAESLRTLVRNLREGIYITNERGVILDANPAFLEMLGVAHLDDLASYGLGDMVVDPARRMHELELLDRDGAVREFELQILRPDGAIRTVLDTTYTCLDPVSGQIFYHGILVDISSRKEQEDLLREQSIRDPLTGCYNRRHLTDIDHRLGGPDSTWACIFIDIDHFKQYNDEHGHQMGDHTLIRMSRFLMRQVRAEEAVVRIGGDEFLIVLEGAGEAQAEMVARRLQKAALRTAPVPFSLGWAARRPSETFQQTMHRADQNLLAVRVIERSAERGKLDEE